MARPMTSVAVGRVNRRFLFLALILATLSGILAYAALSSGGGGGGTSPANITVVYTKDSIAAGTTITADLLEERVVPQTAVGLNPAQNIDDIVNKKIRYPIGAGEAVLLSDVIGTELASNDVLSNLLESGQRGMAVTVEAVVGAGGLVLPGDHVDIFWLAEDPLTDIVGAQLLAENVEVVAVQQTLVELPPTAPGVTEDNPDEETAPGAPGNDRIRGSEAAPIPDASTVTLMLTPQQAQNVFCGDATGTIRLGVRAFGDDSPSGLVPVACLVQGRNGQ